MRILQFVIALTLGMCLQGPTSQATTLLLALDRTRAAEFANLEALLDPAVTPSPWSSIAVEMIGLNKTAGEPIHQVRELPKLLDAATELAHQRGTLSLPASLAKLDHRLAALGEDRRVVVMLSDLDLDDPDTHLKALSDGWLTNPVSPLILEWLGKDANGFKDADIIVLTRTGEALSVRRLREGFFAKAFAKVGARLRYFGPAPHGPEAMVFVRDMLAATLANTLAPVAPQPLGPSPLLQLIDQTGTTGSIEITAVPAR